MATPKYTNKLSNTSVLVIGGTSGLGFGLAEALIEHNVSHLYISSSRQQKVDSSISRLQSSYPDSKTKIQGFACNLGDDASLESNIKDLFSRIDGKLDHVVYTAGDPLAAKSLKEVDFGFMKQAGMVRFFAPFFVAQEAAKHMNPSLSSSITITTGSVSEKPLQDWTVVAAYASGLHGMVRGLAVDMRPVRVNLISPGAVKTELWENSMGSKENVAAAMEHFKTKMLTGEVGAVEDVVESYLYVLKDRNITGSVVRTDGGCFLI